MRRSAVQQTREIVRGFLKAFLAGVRVAIEQPDLSKRAVAKYFATKDPEIIKEAYKGFAPLFPKVPYLTDDAMRLDPKMFYDNRFLQELEASGFVRDLYGSK